MNLQTSNSNQIRNEMSSGYPMTYNNITCQIDTQVAIITINRPSKLNALNSETISELHVAISSLQNNTSVKAIIITGSGPKAFVAGADISEFADFNYEQAKRLSHQGQSKLFSFIDGIYFFCR